jgi:predicted branched-subunit amino acid permease
VPDAVGGGSAAGGASEPGRRADRHADLRTGLRDGVGIALGYFTISIAFGLSCVRTGLSPLVATVISFTNLSSSGQFAGVTIIAQAGTVGELALTVLLINLRYVLMSFSLSQRLAPGIGTAPRLLMGYGVTDEIYALAMNRRVVTAPYYLGLMALPVLGWTLGTLAGALLGQVLPASLQSAMGVLLYAMFVAIVVPPARASGPVFAVVAIAATVSMLLAGLPGLAAGWRLILATCVAAGVGATLFPVVDAAPPPAGGRP